MKKILNKYVAPLFVKKKEFIFDNIDENMDENTDETMDENMDEFKLSDDVFDQIKDFNHQYLTEEQKLLIDKLILNEELKQCYKYHGLCIKCKQPKNNCFWCQICAFQQNFQNWTSGNHDVDEFIPKSTIKS